MEEEIRTKIRGFLLRSFPNYALKDEEDIFAVGFVNSLFALQLVLFVEREFSIHMEDEDLTIDNFRSVDAMTCLIQRKVV